MLPTEELCRAHSSPLQAYTDSLFINGWIRYHNKGNQDVVWMKARNGTAELVFRRDACLAENLIQQEWGRLNKRKSIQFCIIISNVLKLLLFPHLLKSSSFTGRHTGESPLLSASLYWSISFHWILLLTHRAVTSVFNMFKVLPRWPLLPLPGVAKQGELVTHSSQQRAKARQPPLPPAAPDNVLTSQVFVTLKQIYR